jgi:hypothetical protein
VDLNTSRTRTRTRTRDRKSPFHSEGSQDALNFVLLC